MFRDYPREQRLPVEEFRSRQEDVCAVQSYYVVRVTSRVEGEVGSRGVLVLYLFSIFFSLCWLFLLEASVSIIIVDFCF